MAELGIANIAAPVAAFAFLGLPACLAKSVTIQSRVMKSPAARLARSKLV